MPEQAGQHCWHKAKPIHRGQAHETTDKSATDAGQRLGCHHRRHDHGQRQRVGYDGPDVVQRHTGSAWRDAGDMVFRQRAVLAHRPDRSGRQRRLEPAAFLQKLVECCDVPRSIEADILGLGQGRTAMVYNNFECRNWQNEFPDLLQYAGLGLVPAGPQGTDWTSRAMWRRRFPRACPGRGRRSHWASGPRT